MSQLADKYYSVEEYLTLEEKAVDKSEYFDGKISLRDLSSVDHVRITCNAIIELPAIGVNITVDRLYERVKFPVKPPEQPFRASHIFFSYI